MDGNATNRDVDGTLTSVNTFFNTLDSTERFNQFSEQLTTGQTFGGTIAYTEPLSERIMAQVSYSPSFNINASDKETRTFDSTQTGGIIEPQLSSNFTNNYTTHKALGLLRFRGDSSIITVGATAQQALLTGNQSFPVAFGVDRTFFNILPQLMCRYALRQIVTCVCSIEQIHKRQVFSNYRRLLTTLIPCK